MDWQHALVFIEAHFSNSKLQLVKKAHGNFALERTRREAVMDQCTLVFVDHHEGGELFAQHACAVCQEAVSFWRKLLAQL
jgi:hypothetical protein